MNDGRVKVTGKPSKYFSLTYNSKSKRLTSAVYLNHNSISQELTSAASFHDSYYYKNIVVAQERIHPRLYDKN